MSKKLTKEEIWYNAQEGDVSWTVAAMKAMSEYATQETIEKDKEIERLNEFYINFIKWKDDEANPFLMLKNGRYVQACGNSTEWTLSQLIELFKTSNS